MVFLFWDKSMDREESFIGKLDIKFLFYAFYILGIFIY